MSLDAVRSNGTLASSSFVAISCLFLSEKAREGSSRFLFDITVNLAVRKEFLEFFLVSCNQDAPMLELGFSSIQLIAVKKTEWILILLT